MHCGNCGTEIDKTAHFCSNCGTPIAVGRTTTSADATQPAAPVSAGAVGEKGPPEPPEAPSRGRRRWLILGGVGLLLLAVLGGGVAAFVLHSGSGSSACDLVKHATAGGATPDSGTLRKAASLSGTDPSLSAALSRVGGALDSPGSDFSLATDISYVDSTCHSHLGDSGAPLATSTTTTATTTTTTTPPSLPTSPYFDARKMLIDVVNAQFDIMRRHIFDEDRTTFRTAENTATDAVDQFRLKLNGMRFPPRMSEDVRALIIAASTLSSALRGDAPPAATEAAGSQFTAADAVVQHDLLTP